jgi:hypothetical protein
MSFHPAYPSTADLSREASAIQRDLADIATLRELRRIVLRAIASLSQCDDLRHPDKRWSTGDLQELLEGALTDIADEAERIKRSPAVLEEAE